MVEKVLVVEDSPMVMKVLRHVMMQDCEIEPVYATSLKETQEAIAAHTNFFAALVDLSLPDAPDGEVVDFVLSHDIPSIVLTASFNKEKRESLLAKGIVDYVTKEGRYSYEYALGVIQRLRKNRAVKVMVVDDSEMALNLVSRMLRLHLYQVCQAEDGVHAIKVLLDNPDIKLLITDYNMPRMDGFELVRNIRLKYGKSDLVIVGLSSEHEDTLSAQFIKNGANDFLRKPFNHEEFFCRINQNLDYLELIETIREAASRDDVTGARNRRYFLDRCEEQWQESTEKQTPMAVAALQLDDVKNLIESYGEQQYEFVLQQFMQKLAPFFERFVLAYSGKDNFLVLLRGLNREQARQFIERVRVLILGESVRLGQDEISLSLSAGIASYDEEGVVTMLQKAKDAMNSALAAGGELVLDDD